MYVESDVRIGCFAADIFYFISFAWHADQIPLAITDKTFDVSVESFGD